MNANRLLPLVAALVFFGAACSSGDGGSDATPSGAGSSEIVAEVATYETVAGEPSRFLLGLFTPDGVVSYGTVAMSFSSLGDGSASPTRGPQATGSFLLVPNDDAGQPPATDAQLQAAADKPPAFIQPDQTRGVYQAEDLTFDSPGVWQVDATIVIDGTTHTASANFVVVDKAAYPAIGEKAPAVDNHLDGEKDAKPSWVDSRATDSWSQIPDPRLHDITVRDALDRGDAPIVIVVSTPLYCQSRFCGPVTDEVQQLADDYRGSAYFVHLEVWKDYQNKVLNEAAAAYVYRSDITEPWVFLVDSDGAIVDRWQNVVDRPQLQKELEGLIQPSTGPPF
jgi:hypothetical protein